MLWALSYKADRRALPVANRHYNRQKPESPVFTPPGRDLTLLTPNARALWVTSFPYAEYVLHDWGGAWVCSMFRNEESGYRAASLIRDAIAATRFWFGEPPPLGMITFIDPAQVNPIRRRHTTPSGYVWEFDVWGYVWERVGFEYVGQTKEKGLLAFQLTPDKMPKPIPPLHYVKEAGGKDLPATRAEQFLDRLCSYRPQRVG